jgi:hypothetical protein
MNRWFARFGVPLLAACALAGCESSKSANPLSPTVAGPIPGVNITAPKPLDPSSGEKVAPDSQPITLTVENASTTGVRPLQYLFEVASDSAFSQKLFSREGITPGDGRTSLRLPDALATGHTYYWRARAQDGANTGPFSTPTAFQVLQPITIDAPTLIGPVGGQTVNDNPPQLRIKNANHTGPVGAIGYRVQVSANDSFTAMAYEELAPEQPGETHVTPNSPLAPATKFYWRARATDGTNTGPWSGTASFVTPASAPPPPTGGGGGDGGGGGGGGGGGPGGSCASRDGHAIVDCIADKYASYRRSGVSAATRRSNMEFLRNRIIEAGICGGLDLGWNLKRGGPDLSVDFIVDRRGGQSIGVDIARDYDNTSKELVLTWAEDGPGSHYKSYSPRPTCN